MHHHKEKKYQIIAKNFCNKLNRLLINIRTENSEIISATADQLSLNKHIINSLSQIEAHCIGYIAGYEHALSTPLSITPSASIIKYPIIKRGPKKHNRMRGG